MAKGPLDLSNEILSRPLNPKNYDDFVTQLGRHPTDEEYKGWIKPKVKASFDEYTKQGLDRKTIRSELRDAYGYDDLIDEAMGGSEDDDWFADVKTNTKFPEKVFREDIKDWDGLYNSIQFLEPTDRFNFLRGVVKVANELKGGK